MRGGRTRAELAPTRRRKLVRLARREAELELRLATVRAELVEQARAARLEGASLRAIGEATGRSTSRVHELTHSDTPSTDS